MRPLPVEKSQGSVSALVARFQTAAAHNAATAQREASRRSSSSSSSSNPGVGDGPRVVSAGGWRKASGEVAPTSGAVPVPGPSKGDDEDMEVLDDAKEKVSAEEVKKAEGSAPAAAKPNGSVWSPAPDKGPSPVGATPKRSAAPQGKVATTPTPASAKNPTSPKASRNTAASSTPSSASKPAPPSPKVSTSPRQRVTSASRSLPPKKSAGADNRAVGKDVDGTAHAPQLDSPTVAKKADAVMSSPNNGIALSSSSGSLKRSPTTGSSGFSKTAPTSATSRTTVTRTIPSPTTVKAASKASTALSEARSPTATSSTPATKSKIPTATPKPRPASTITPAPKAVASNPPSAFKSTKPLTPSMTGPASSRRSSSAFGQTPVPTPLRPQLTGTPSKPTASSLAKSRGTPSTNDNTGTGITSLGRSGSKRMSLGPVSSLSDGSVRRAGSQSPAASSKVVEGKAQRDRVTGSSSMSRLMQGTAASRAKVIEGLPGTPTPPTKAKLGGGVKEGVVRSVSVKGMAGATKNVRAKLAEPRPIDPGSKYAGPAPQATAAAGDEPKEESAEDVALSSRGEQESSAAGEATQPSLLGTGVAPLGAETAQLESVGDSPIGRIGLAGAPHPASTLLGTSGETSGIGQNPSVGTAPSSPVASQPESTSDAQEVVSGEERTGTSELGVEVDQSPIKSEREGSAGDEA